MGFRLMRNFDHPYFSGVRFLSSGADGTSPFRHGFPRLCTSRLGEADDDAAACVELDGGLPPERVCGMARVDVCHLGALNGAYMVASHASVKIRWAIVALSGFGPAAVLSTRPSPASLRFIWFSPRGSSSVRNPPVTRRSPSSDRNANSPGLETPVGQYRRCDEGDPEHSRLIACEIIQLRIDLRALVANQSVAIRWPAVVWHSWSASSLLGNVGADQRFIYFQF